MKFIDWYYSTWLGGKHLEFLLWLDTKRKIKVNYLTPGEVQQIVREYSLISRGVVEVKSKVNSLVRARSKEEYRKTLEEIEDLLPLAERDPNSAEGQFANLIRRTYDTKSNIDVVTATDRAKMVEKKIQAVKELQEHKAQRDMLREVRKLHTEGKKDEADKLFKEWEDKYGRQRTRRR